MAPKSPWIAGFYNHLPLNTSTPLPTLTLGPLDMDFRKLKFKVRSQDDFFRKILTQVHVLRYNRIFCYCLHFMLGTV